MSDRVREALRNTLAWIREESNISTQEVEDMLTAAQAAERDRDAAREALFQAVNYLTYLQSSGDVVPAERERAAELRDKLDRIALALTPTPTPETVERVALCEMLSLFVDPTNINDLPDDTRINLTAGGPTLGQLKRWRAAIRAMGEGA